MKSNGSIQLFPRVFLTYMAAPMSASVVRPGTRRYRSSLLRVQWAARQVGAVF